jgi:hypothetical protein
MDTTVTFWATVKSSPTLGRVAGFFEVEAYYEFANSWLLNWKHIKICGVG